MELSKIYRGCKKGGRPSMAKNWFVSYLRNGDRVKEYGDINRGETIQEREVRARALKESVDLLLMDAYINGEPLSEKLTLKEGLEWALDQKRRTWRKGSEKEYLTPLRIFYAVTDRLGYTNKDINQVTKPVMMQVLEQMLDDRMKVNKDKGFNRPYNYLKYKNNIGNLFKVLKKYEKVKDNPCDFENDYKKPKGKKPAPITPAQVKLIHDKLESCSTPFFKHYVTVVNMTGIRPKELYSIRVADVDLRNRVILIHADIAKDKEDRLVPIPKNLIPYLEELHLELHEHDSFVFGIDFIPEARAMPVKRDRATKLWNSLIIAPKSKGGLGLPIKMYWMKHYGTKSRIEAGVSDVAVQYGLGHASLSETYDYSGLDTSINIQQIYELTPDPWK